MLPYLHPPRCVILATVLVIVARSQGTPGPPPALAIPVRAAGVAAAAQQPRAPVCDDLVERVAELCVEDGVDDWVEGGVEVADPREDLERCLGDAFAESLGYVCAEEGDPAD